MNKDRQITCIFRQAEQHAIDGSPRRSTNEIDMSIQSARRLNLFRYLPDQHPSSSTSRARSFLHQRSTACCSYCLPADKLFDQVFAALLRVFAGCRFAAPLCCQSIAHHVNWTSSHITLTCQRSVILGSLRSYGKPHSGTWRRKSLVEVFRCRRLTSSSMQINKCSQSDGPWIYMS